MSSRRPTNSCSPTPPRAAAATRTTTGIRGYLDARRGGARRSSPRRRPRRQAAPRATRPHEAFLDIVRTDAARARAALRFVLAQRAIGSQIVDNLNASTHLRTLLTDLFLLDEALKISGI